MPSDILIIEDEPAIQQMLSFALKRSGYTSTTVDSIRKAWNVLKNKPPSLILLDWMLPDKTGISFLTEIRKNKAYDNIPVIMLTARAEESSKIRGLESGADDYITKPFSPKELTARIKAILKRYKPKDKANNIKDEVEELDIILKTENLELNQTERTLKIYNEKIKIGPLEFKLLYYLVKSPNKTRSREKLLERVWDNKAGVTDRTVDVHIRRVRKLLEPSGYYRNIVSIRGIGYKFQLCEND